MVLLPVSEKVLTLQQSYDADVAQTGLKLTHSFLDLERYRPSSYTVLKIVCTL